MAAKQVNGQRRCIIACEDQGFGVDDLDDDSHGPAHGSSG